MGLLVGIIVSWAIANSAENWEIAVGMAIAVVLKRFRNGDSPFRNGDSPFRNGDSPRGERDRPRGESCGNASIFLMTDGGIAA